jgi:polysaccharide biosynthesis transport protein
MNPDRSAIPPSLMPDNIAGGSGLESDDLSFRQAIRVVRKNKYIVLGTALVLATTVLVVSFIMRPYYSSTAAIELEAPQNELGADALGAAASSLTGGDEVKTEIQTEVSVLESDDLGIETIEKTHFEDHQETVKHRLGISERAPEERGLPLSQAPKARSNLLVNFESHLKVLPIPDTRLIQVTFEDPDARFAAETVNALISQYVQDRFDRRNSSTLQATGWMTGEINDLKKQVQEAEQNLIEYQRKSGLIVLPGGGNPRGSGDVSEGPMTTSPVLDRLTQLDADLVTAETNRITMEALFRLASSGNVDALSSTALQMQASEPGNSQNGLFTGLLALRQQETALKLQQSSVAQTYGAKNPHLLDLNNQMDMLDQEIKTEVQRIVNTTEMNYKAALQTENGIRSAYAAEEQEAFKMNDSTIRLAVLQQEADSTRGLYEDLYTKLQELKLTVGTQSSNIAVISRALPAARPTRPRKLLYTAIGLLAGLVLGVFGAFIHESLDDSVTSIQEVENLSAVPVLAGIPSFISSSISLPGKRPFKGPSKNAERQSYGKSTSEVSEAYRTLRTAILLSHPGQPPRTLLVTSAVSGEGKTTTCYGLGACFAGLGHRVLLIDADMRRPSLHLHLNTADKRGLSNLLTSALSPPDCVIEDPNVKSLFILQAGTLPPNPAELLASKEFDGLLDTLSAQYDFILIDSPPAMVVTDASILSVKVDAVLVVIRWAATSRSAISRIFETFRRNRAKVLGIAFNAVNTKSAEYYYERGYYGTDYKSEDKDAKRES